MAEMERRKLAKAEEIVPTGEILVCDFPKDGGCKGHVLKDSNPPRCVAHVNK
jgi:hypothetical protein